MGLRPEGERRGLDLHKPGRDRETFLQVIQAAIAMAAISMGVARTSHVPQPIRIAAELGRTRSGPYPICAARLFLSAATLMVADGR